jgi:hypothetical protein
MNLETGFLELMPFSHQCATQGGAGLFKLLEIAQCYW